MLGPVPQKGHPKTNPKTGTPWHRLVKKYCFMHDLGRRRVPSPSCRLGSSPSSALVRKAPCHSLVVHIMLRQLKGQDVSKCVELGTTDEQHLVMRMLREQLTSPSLATKFVGLDVPSWYRLCKR